MRYSRQREALIELLCSTKSHPDAQWLYEELRKEYPNISLGTVYRNLRQLTELGEILELRYSDSSHFDGDISPHYHMRCSACSKIIDIPKESINVEIKTENGFLINGIDILLSGICRECQN